MYILEQINKKAISLKGLKPLSKLNRSSAFTIVELLVVIVVIGVLAAITIVAYNGIANRAAIAALNSDLTNASRQLKIFKVVNGVYPTTIDCSIPNSSTNNCIKLSSNNTYNYKVDTAYNNSTFILYATIKSTNTTYHITNKSSSPLVEKTYKQVATGFYHACGIASDDQAYCWGNNVYGSLGNNATVNSPIPARVNKTGVLSGLTIKSIAGGAYHTCAIASDNNAYCWGRNNNGQLGNSSTTTSFVPVAVNRSGALNGLTIKSITAGYYHTCVIASDDNAYCWGDGAQGELGRGSTSDSSAPVAVSKTGVLNGLTIKSITNGFYHTCAIASDNNSYCWGDNAQGQLGNNSVTDSSIPVAVNTSGVLSGLTIKSITGFYHTCAIASDNNSYCWGDNAQGQLGNNSTADSRVPVAVYTAGVLNGLTIKYITTGYYDTCVIASNNQAYCWGDGAYGQLGRNSTSDSHAPVAVTNTGALSGLNLVSISGGYYFNCTIASDNNAYCWGDDTYGQLGNNSSIKSLIPVITVTP